MWDGLTIMDFMLKGFQLCGPSPLRVTPKGVQPTSLWVLAGKVGIFLAIEAIVMTCGFFIIGDYQPKEISMDMACTFIMVALGPLVMAGSIFGLIRGSKDIQSLNEFLGSAKMCAKTRQDHAQSFCWAMGCLILCLLLAGLVSGISGALGFLQASGSHWAWSIPVVCIYLGIELLWVTNPAVFFGTTLFFKNTSQLIAHLEEWNNRLRILATRDQPTSPDEIQDGYTIVESLSQYETGYGTFLCVHMTQMVTFMTLSMYTQLGLFFNPFSVMSVMNSMSYAFLTAQFCILLVLYCQCGQELKNSVLRGKFDLEALLKKEQSHWSKKDTLKGSILIRRLDRRQFLRPLGYFKLNNSIILNVWNTIITYLIVLINFRFV